MINRIFWSEMKLLVRKEDSIILKIFLKSSKFAKKNYHRSQPLIDLSCRDLQKINGDKNFI